MQFEKQESFQRLVASDMAFAADVSESFLQIPESVSRPYMEFLEFQMNYRRQAQPWIPEVELKSSCEDEIKAIEILFPGFGDETMIRGLASAFSFLSDIDDLIEAIPLPQAGQCVDRCVAICEGRKFQDVGLESPSGKAQLMTTVICDLILSLFPHADAAAINHDIGDMIAGQLEELKMKESGVAVADYQTYMEIRWRPFGLMPLLTILERFYLDGKPASDDLVLMRHQVVLAGLVQNDVGGIEKDIKQGNVSTTIKVLAKLHGHDMRSSRDVIEKQQVLRQTEAVHDALIQDIITTYLRIQNQSKSAQEIQLSRRLLLVSNTQLKWTLSSPRYDIDRF
ncbi:unnamed protein product [Fusarium fujikuroi]|uniref:Uncharacterized protein n=1 Tax=Fusarium fujikuroi TaxID=5127 RepID=A0A2H3SG59_FUSFU|nr:uncharacterized protein FFE2_15944 [Fusarium fujikuroi]SCO25524.1 uncharacterized protein FFC1_15567 [Fusarium fujikuroi]SCO54036.1 uncharacterized protein FFNC_15305 [Fusarium fujikuroi]VTT78184.1 unnamed protein product [Fusarium fujikuroi]VZI11089.1 unnamed protein product [Fusarium fujikuroi]